MELQVMNVGRLRGTGSGKPPALGNFLKLVTKMVHFRHISAKI